MPDYPTPAHSASTPNFPASASAASTASIDADHLADLLARLARIPRDELPDDARAGLVEAIRAGQVDNLYRPLGCDHWNISWANRPAWVDPRQNIMSWILEYRAYQAMRGGDA